MKTEADIALTLALALGCACSLYICAIEWGLF